MYKAVTNSNVLPIVASFDIKVLPSDSNGTVIDFTDYIASDNDVLFFSGNAKSAFQVGGYQSDKSYINAVKSYPLNIEIKTVKTYSKGGGSGNDTRNAFCRRRRAEYLIHPGTEQLYGIAAESTFPATVL